MIDDDPPHPIIEKLYEYEIIGFSYERDPHDWHDCHFDLVLKKDKIIRRLRFLSPQNLHIGGGLPSCSGMLILDVSQRQLEGLNVRVVNYENSEPAVELWAREVIDLDELKR